MISNDSLNDSNLHVHLLIHVLHTKKKGFHLRTPRPENGSLLPLVPLMEILLETITQGYKSGNL